MEIDSMDKIQQH